MQKPFDIFWFGDNGPNWIEAVETLEAAKAHLEKLPQVNSGSYAVLDQRTGKRVVFGAEQVPGCSEKAPGLAKYAKAG
jgi:hypothetical protein